MKKKKTIKGVLIFTNSILLLLVFAALCSVIYILYSSFQEQQLHQFAQDTANQIAYTFEIYFDELENLAESTATNSALLDNWNKLQSEDDYDAFLARKKLQQYFNDIQKNRNDVISIGLFDQTTYIELQNYKKDYAAGDAYLDDIWQTFSETKAVEARYFGLHLFNYYHNTLLQSPPTVVSLVYPVRDVTKLATKNEALLIFDIDLSHIKDLVFNEANKSNTYTALILDEDQIVYSSDERTYITGTVLESNSKDHLQQIAVDVPMQSTGWQIRVIYDTKTMSAQANQLLAFILIALIIAFFALLFASVAVSREITKPIWALVDKMGQIRSEDLSTSTLSLNSPTKLYELDKLYTGYNYLMEQIIALKVKSYEAEIKQQEANFKALQAQIDPHFINNVLQMIQSLAVLNKVPEIRATTSAMGDLLEYSIYAKENYVPLSKEIHYIERYLEIQKIRLGSAFQYSIQIESQALEIMIPRFILQPLVENAVVHGVNDVEEKVISIVGEILDDRLYLSVVDNGLGISEERLEAIRNTLNQDEHPSGSIGLYNVHQRIQMRYGADYGMEIQSQIGEGTCVTILIPAQEGGKGNGVDDTSCR